MSIPIHGNEPFDQQPVVDEVVRAVLATDRGRLPHCLPRCLVEGGSLFGADEFTLTGKSRRGGPTGHELQLDFPDLARARAALPAP